MTHLFDHHQLIWRQLLWNSSEFRLQSAWQWAGEQQHLSTDWWRQGITMDLNDDQCLLPSSWAVSMEFVQLFDNNLPETDDIKWHVASFNSQCLRIWAHEGVRNLRATGTLAHGLFPCCLGNNGAGRKMSILAVLWALSCVESERAVRVCGPWRESDEWCFIPDDYLLCVTQLWVRGPLSCSSEENWEKSTELLWIAKWDTLTAHVIVKYRLMGIIKLEHCLTQSFSWMLHKGEYQCCRVKTFQLQFWTSVEWLYFSICS